MNTEVPKPTPKIDNLLSCPNPKCESEDVHMKCKPGLNKKRYYVSCRKCTAHTVQKYLTVEAATKAWNGILRKEATK